MGGKLLFHEIEKREEFETLLDKKITLTGKNSVFSLNNEVINLAGVVGGKSTSCSANTKTVIIECAFFKPSISAVVVLNIIASRMEQRAETPMVKAIAKVNASIIGKVLHGRVVQVSSQVGRV